MKILVACEESQAVTIELRRLGHEAYSCDIIECSGGHPEWHIMQDVLEILNPSSQLNGLSHEYYGVAPFKTMDEVIHFVSGKWDMIIAFPPCTDLAVSGARYFAQKRADGRQQRSIDFFMEFATADCDRIAIENPVGIMSSHWRKPDQIIQPWQFGHNASKKTCLWLRGLPCLVPTNIVDAGEFVVTGKDKKRYTEWLAWVKDENGKTLGWNDPRTAKMRSKTFQGIAKAMAEQWAGKCEEA